MLPKLPLWVYFTLFMTIVGCFFGWYIKPDQQSQPVTVVKTQIVEKTVERRPDGTVVETEVTKNIDTTKNELDKPAKKEYNLSSRFATKFDHTPGWKDLDIGVGKRIVGDLWGELGYSMRDGAIGLGLRFDF